MGVASVYNTRASVAPWYSCPSALVQYVNVLTVTKDPEAGLNMDTTSRPQEASESNRLVEPTWLSRNYYRTPWMTGAEILAEVQIMFFTLFILTELVITESAFKIFRIILSWFFATQPLLTYCYILLGVIGEGSETPVGRRLKRLEQRFWSRLPPKAQKLLSQKHYTIYPIILSGLSVTVALLSGIYAFALGIGGLCLCYLMMWLTLQYYDNPIDALHAT